MTPWAGCSKDVPVAKAQASTNLAERLLRTESDVVVAGSRGVTALVIRSGELER